ncbi:DUF937 domain-containing protein [Jonesiaceae bacterium BS-20]|uniref:DUF937 domain-containing protein n=1 Tax=Jonesiaceae bacterium BS-20 TaxID=3120821 RepID=A0AAU7DUB0_9MICO
MSSAIDNILQSLPTEQIADRLGIPVESAQPLIGEAVEALVSGLSANSTDEAGAASLVEALGQHSGSLLEGGVNLADVDEQDGNAIVSNIFGGNTDSVIKTLGSKSKTGDESLVSPATPHAVPRCYGVPVSAVPRQKGYGVRKVIGWRSRRPPRRDSWREELARISDVPAGFGIEFLSSALGNGQTTLLHARVGGDLFSRRPQEEMFPKRGRLRLLGFR